MEVNEFDISVRVRLLKDGNVAYGSGISKLLRKTRQLGSLNSAAKDLGMPYRKALKIVNQAEEAFQRPIITKRIGGVGGGGSELTEFGQYLVTQFHAIEQEVQQFTEKKVTEQLKAFDDN